MIIKLIIPIEALKGQLRKDGYYYRTWKGKQIVQRCPNRKGHVKTAAEAMNQERFIEKYRKKKSKGERLMAKGEGGRTTSALTRGEEDGVGYDPPGIQRKKPAYNAGKLTYIINPSAMHRRIQKN